jgi:hypothetical protein
MNLLKSIVVTPVLCEYFNKHLNFNFKPVFANMLIILPLIILVVKPFKIIFC